MDKTVVLTSAITGVVSGAIGTFLIAPARERHRLWSLSTALGMEVLSPESDQHYRLLVRNDGVEAVVDAIGYVTLNNTPEDILDGRPAFEGPGHRPGVRNGRLSWALAGNPHKVDIFPGEKQLLNFAQIIKSSKGDELVVSSEVGFGDIENKPARVSLKPKRYAGTITVVAKNILAQAFDIEVVIVGSSFGRPMAPQRQPSAKKWPFVLASVR